jgi:hypothetical protein
LVFATVTVALSSLAMACAGPGTQGTTTGGEGGEGGSSSSTGGMGGAGGGMMNMPGPPEFVVKFNPVMGELPEGIAVDGKTAYVAFGSTKVITVDLETGTRNDFGTVGLLGIASPQGLFLDAQKNLYAAVSSADVGQFTPGIYKFPPGGGTATLFAQDASMSYPRHIAFMAGGDAIISDPVAGMLLSMSPSGTVQTLQSTNFLMGTASTTCGWGGSTLYGVTSVVDLDGITIASNADRASIIDVATGESFAGPDCETLGGGESLVVDPYDKGPSGVQTRMYLAARKVNKITRVIYEGFVKVEMVSDSADLHEPSAIAMGELGTDRYLFIVNSARTTFNTGGVPGLLKMRLGPVK